MNRIKIISRSEKRQIEKQLKEQYGINEIPGILIQSGSERIFLFQGSMSIREIKNLEQDRIPIERIGVYFAKEQGAQIRLSIEGIHVLKNQITKNIFQLNEKQLDEWMHGNELNIKTEKRGFLIMKYKNDFVGSGKASENKITNFIPKSRRLKV